MPEHAEVKITSFFINTLDEEIFSEIGISKVTQNKIDTHLPFKKFKILSFARGKELKITLYPLSIKYSPKSLVMGFGMTGNWKILNEKEFKETKHIHLYLKGKYKDGDVFYLSFQDVRRFARWGWGNWSENRGPDPLMEGEEFVRNIQNNLDKKTFNGRILEVLLDQRYFNGVGNYLRAEILAQADVNPFLPAREILQGKDGEKFLKLVRCVIAEAHETGGAQLKDWKNPFGKDKKRFESWLRVYGKGESMLDKQKRNFWYLSKWKKEEYEKI